MNIRKLAFIAFVGTFLFFHSAHAQAIPGQSLPAVDYHGQPAVDSDSDGLTDEGEKQIFQTEPKTADTDGDGFDDGVEAVAGTNPLDPSSFPGMVIPLSQTASPQYETPWAWYTARASGLVGFLLLYVSIFLGITLRVPFLRKIFAPVYSMSIHCWISLYATVFAFVHGGVLLWDKFYNFTLADIFIPFASKFEPGLVALGTLGFYLMVILVVTSYGRKFISQKLWRITHFTNLVLYVIVLVHAVKLGTDMKNPTIFWTFIWMNAFLIFIMLYNLELRISESWRRKIENDQLPPAEPPTQTI